MQPGDLRVLGIDYAYTIQIVTDGSDLAYTATLMSGTTILSSARLSGSGTFSRSFNPTITTATLTIVPTFGSHHSSSAHFINLQGIYLPRYNAGSMNVVSQVCDEDLYHYGFNGKTKDNEWAGIGNSLDFKFRGLDTRIGRFRSVDPLAVKYPWNGTYNFAEDRVIDGKDLEGKEWSRAQDGNTVTWTVKIQVVNQSKILDDCNSLVGMQGYLDVYKTETEKAYSVQNGGTQYKLNIEFTTEEAPFKLVFTDETIGKPQKVDGQEGVVGEIGNTQRNTIYVRMGMAYPNGDLDPSNNARDMTHSVKTFAGELGHTGGLLHPYETRCDEQIPGMNDSWTAGKENNNVMNHRDDAPEGMEVNKSQQAHIDNKVKEQQKNPKDAKGVKCTEK